MTSPTPPGPESHSNKPEAPSKHASGTQLARALLPVLGLVLVLVRFCGRREAPSMQPLDLDNSPAAVCGSRCVMATGDHMGSSTAERCQSRCVAMHRQGRSAAWEMAFDQCSMLCGFSPLLARPANLSASLHCLDTCTASTLSDGDAGASDAAITSDALPSEDATDAAR